MIDGILLFNKPILWTSHDAVDFVRRRVGQRQVGHAGTLDPLATGLLVILLGGATKRFKEFEKLDKDYEGTLTLGLATDTLDLEGRILSTDECAASAADVRKAFAGLTGEQAQAAPLYSAVRVKGRKLYDLTRSGVAVNRLLRQITVTSFEPLRIDGPDVHFVLTCSKGTYVRSLCDEVGRRLGCGAVLSSLVRRRIGGYHLKDALDEPRLGRMTPAQIREHLQRV